MACRSLALIAAALTLTACGSAAGEPVPAGFTAQATTSVTPSQDGVFTLAFAGDVHFERDLRALLDEPDNSLQAIAPLLDDADIAMVNLETAITDRGAPEPKTYTFRTSPVALAALAAAGVDVVSMANNHGVDFGGVGLEDTLAARADAPLAVIGIGKDADDAFTPHTATIEGTTVAIIAATDLNDRTAQAWTATDTRPGVASAVEPERLLDAVRTTAEVVDLVVVYLHWGTEHVDCPVQAQRELAEQLADAGADIIVGSHAHVLLGSGWRGRTYVNYGLGNFIWYHGRNEAVASTGVLTLTVREGQVAEHSWSPARIPRGGGVPERLDGPEADSALARWDERRECANVSGRP